MASIGQYIAIIAALFVGVIALKSCVQANMREECEVAGGKFLPYSETCLPPQGKPV